MDHLILEVVEGHHVVEQKLSRDNKPYFEQKAYAHFGGAFPQEFVMRLESPANAYAIGKYIIKSESFRVNQYRKLELNPYGLVLEHITPRQPMTSKS
jgi:hypothetical protein